MHKIIRDKYFNFEQSFYVQANFTETPIDEAKFTEECRNELEKKGVVTLHNFLKPETVKELVREAKSHSDLAYFTNSSRDKFFLSIIALA